MFFYSQDRDTFFLIFLTNILVFKYEVKKTHLSKLTVALKQESLLVSLPPTAQSHATVICCLSLCVSPPVDRQPVQGVPRLSPYDSWDWLQPTHNPESNKKIGEILMWTVDFFLFYYVLVKDIVIDAILTTLAKCHST